MRCRLPGPQLPGADGEFTSQMRLSARREGSNFLVPDMKPLDLALAANRVGQTVQAIADDAVDPLDARGRQSLGELVGYCLCHGTHSSLRSSALPNCASLLRTPPFNIRQSRVITRYEWAVTCPGPV